MGNENSGINLHLDDFPIPEHDHDHDHDHRHDHDFLLILLVVAVFINCIGDGCVNAKVNKRLDALEKRIPVPAEATKP